MSIERSSSLDRPRRVWRSCLLALAIFAGAGCANGDSGSVDTDDSALTNNTPITDAGARVLSGPTITRCSAPNPEKWMGLPNDLDVASLARRMNISEELVRAGKFGPAVCYAAVDIPSIQAGRAHLHVDNVGETCLATHVASPHLRRGNSTNFVLAVCAPPGSAPNVDASSL